MPQEIVRGSQADIARARGQTLVQALLSADFIVLVDTSQSMMEKDSTGGMTRYEVACLELRRVQAELPGQVAIFSFSSECVFCPGGVPQLLAEGTDLLGALTMVSKADGMIKGYLVISDGYPDPGTDFQIIRMVSQFKTKVDTIFAGPVEDDLGRKFMADLANAGRGRSSFNASAAGIADAAHKLLKSG